MMRAPWLATAVHRPKGMRAKVRACVCPVHTCEPLSDASSCHHFALRDDHRVSVVQSTESHICGHLLALLSSTSQTHRMH